MWLFDIVKWNYEYFNKQNLSQGITKHLNQNKYLKDIFMIKDRF